MRKWSDAGVENEVIRQALLNFGSPMEMAAGMKVDLEDFKSTGQHPLQLVAKTNRIHDSPQPWLTANLGLMLDSGFPTVQEFTHLRV